MRVSTSCRNRACPAYGIDVEVDESVTACVVCLHTLAHVGHAPGDLLDSVAVPIANHQGGTTVPMRTVGLAGAGLLALGLVVYGIVEALAPGPGPTTRYSVHRVVNITATTVFSCTNGGHAPAQVEVSLFDGSRAVSVPASTTIEAGATAAFSTGLVWSLPSKVLQVAPLRRGSAEISAPTGVDCSAFVMSKTVPSSLVTNLSVHTDTRPGS